jgi:hypothetical protein
MLRKIDMINQFESKLDTKLLDASLQKLASDFHCGNQYIDLFLRSAQALDDSFGKTYVWLNESGDEIIGFYNISAGSVDYLEDGYRYKMGGAIHINEFAIKQRYQGVAVTEFANISDLLLDDCLERIKYIRNNHIGCSFVTLQSTKEGYSLYLRHDFEDIEEDMGITKNQPAEDGCKAMYMVIDLVV